MTSQWYDENKKEGKITLNVLIEKLACLEISAKYHVSETITTQLKRYRYTYHENKKINYEEVKNRVRQ